MKFKVGDKVRCIKCSSWSYYTNPIIGNLYIKTGESTNKGNWSIFSDHEIGCNINFLDEDFELMDKCIVEEKREYPAPSFLYDFACRSEYKENIFSKSLFKYYISKPMTNIVKFAKDMILSTDEKLLRKHGLKDEYGDYTDEAEKIIMAKILKENESYLLEIAKSKEAEEK